MERGYKVPEPGNGCVETRQLVLPGLRRKSKSLFDFAFELAFDAQTREVNHELKSGRCPDTREDDSDEWLEVVSPAGSQQNIADAEMEEDHTEVVFNDYGFSDATLDN
jgi:hypothetical protein